MKNIAKYHPHIVFLSMVIWRWILGPVGMFLVVPLTITLKMVSSYTEKYRWISVLLSDKVSQ